MLQGIAVEQQTNTSSSTQNMVYANNQLGGGMRVKSEDNTNRVSFMNQMLKVFVF